MAKKKLDEAMRVGDEFLKGKFGKDIHFKLNALLAVILALTIILVFDTINLLLVHLIYSPSPFQVFTSSLELVIVLALDLVAYKFIKDVHEWEHTYKRVKKLLE